MSELAAATAAVFSASLASPPRLNSTGSANPAHDPIVLQPGNMTGESLLSCEGQKSPEMLTNNFVAPASGLRLRTKCSAHVSATRRPTHKIRDVMGKQYTLSTHLSCSWIPTNSRPYVTTG